MFSDRLSTGKCCLTSSAKESRANTHARKKPTDREGLGAHSDTGIFEPVPENNRPSCSKSGVQNDNLISSQKCNLLSYCDKACLEKDWIRHKFVIRLGRQLDEVDDFIQACHEEIIPTDDDVAKAFGFYFFTSGVDRQRLFRLYSNLINQWGVSEN